MENEFFSNSDFVDCGLDSAIPYDVPKITATSLAKIMDQNAAGAREMNNSGLDDLPHTDDQQRLAKMARALDLPTLRRALEFAEDEGMDLLTPTLRRMAKDAGLSV